MTIQERAGVDPPPGPPREPGLPAVPAAGRSGTPSSPRRGLRPAAGISSPVTGAADPGIHMPAAPGRGRVDAPAGASLKAHGSPPAGSSAIAAAMSEDRGPDSLDANVRRMFKALGLMAYHTRTSIGSAKGYPDWTICGIRVMFRELKTQRGKVSADQRAWLDALTLAGQDAGVWRPEDLLSGQIAHELAALAGLKVATA